MTIEAELSRALLGHWDEFAFGELARRDPASAAHLLELRLSRLADAWASYERRHRRAVPNLGDQLVLGEA